MHRTDFRGQPAMMDRAGSRASGKTIRALQCVVVAVFLAAPTTLRAQIPWESPQLIRPGAPGGISLVFIDYGMDPFSGLGGALVYRSAAAPHGFGLRASAAQARGDRVNFAGGIDVSAPLLRASTQFPLDLIWTSGAGASYGTYIQIGVPVGVAAGRAISSKGVWFNPYASARGVLEGNVGNEAPQGDVTLGLVVDVGADLAFGSSRDFLVRLAVSLGDRHAAAVGIHFGDGGQISSVSSTPANRR